MLPEPIEMALDGIAAADGPDEMRAACEALRATGFLHLPKHEREAVFARLYEIAAEKKAIVDRLEAETGATE